MTAEVGGQVPEHGVRLSGNRHQVRRPALSGLCRQRIKLLRRNAHVIGAADVEAHGQCEVDARLQHGLSPLGGEGAKVGETGLDLVDVRCRHLLGVDQSLGQLDEALLEEAANKGIAWTPTLAEAPSFVSIAESFNKPEITAWIKQCLDRLMESKLLQKAVEMNVTILAGTDMIAPGSIPDEIIALHEFGLDTTSAIAAAEVAWSDIPKKDINWFKRKLENFKDILNYLGINYHKVSQNGE